MGPHLAHLEVALKGPRKSRHGTDLRSLNGDSGALAITRTSWADSYC